MKKYSEALGAEFRQAQMLCELLEHIGPSVYPIEEITTTWVALAEGPEKDLRGDGATPLEALTNLNEQLADLYDAGKA